MKTSIEGLDRLNPGYVRSRLKIATSAARNRDELLNALQLLQLDPLIDNLAAVYAPAHGIRTGCAPAPVSRDEERIGNRRTVSLASGVSPLTGRPHLCGERMTI